MGSRQRQTFWPFACSTISQLAAVVTAVVVASTSQHSWTPAGPVRSASLGGRCSVLTVHFAMYTANRASRRDRLADSLWQMERNRTRDARRSAAAAQSAHFATWLRTQQTGDCSSRTLLVHYLVPRCALRGLAFRSPPRRSRRTILACHRTFTHL